MSDITGRWTFFMYDTSTFHNAIIYVERDLCSGALCSAKNIAADIVLKTRKGSSIISPQGFSTVDVTIKQ